MSEARATVELLLSQKRNTLAGVEKQRSELLIEIRTLEGVVALLPVEPEGAPKEDGDPVEHRTRRPTRAWISLLRLASSQGTQPFGYDDLMLAAELEGMEMKAPTLRARMMDYVKAGYVNRIDQGKFLLAKAGTEMIEAAMRDFLPLERASGHAVAPKDETPGVQPPSASESADDTKPGVFS